MGPFDVSSPLPRLRIIGLRDLAGKCESNVRIPGLAHTICGDPTRFLPELTVEPYVSRGSGWSSCVILSRVRVWRQSRSYLVTVRRDDEGPFKGPYGEWHSSLFNKGWFLPVPVDQKELEALKAWLFVHARFCQSFEEATALSEQMKTRRTWGPYSTYQRLMRWFGVDRLLGAVVDGSVLTITFQTLATLSPL